MRLSDDVGATLSSRSKKFLTAPLNFFFTFTFVIQAICENTNQYAGTQILEKPMRALSNGSWDEVTPSEILKFVAYTIHIGIVKVLWLKLCVLQCSPNIQWFPYTTNQAATLFYSFA